MTINCMKQMEENQVKIESSQQLILKAIEDLNEDINAVKASNEKLTSIVTEIQSELKEEDGENPHFVVESPNTKRLFSDFNTDEDSGIDLNEYLKKANKRKCSK